MSGVNPSSIKRDDEKEKEKEKKDEKPAEPKAGGPAPKAPADKAAMAGTHDPNYQTLAGVDANVFADKGGNKPAAAAPAAGAAGAPKPGGPGMAGKI